MMFEAQLSPDDLRLLEDAVNRALALAEERGIEMSSSQFAAILCAAFWNGERDPERLAESIIGVRPNLH